MDSGFFINKTCFLWQKDIFIFSFPLYPVRYSTLTQESKPKSGDRRSTCNSQVTD